MAQKWMRRMRVPPAVLAAVLGLALGAAAAPTPSAVVHVRLNYQHWTTVPLPATPLGIVAHGKDLWAVGWDQMVAESSDGGQTWRILHFQKHGELLFTLVFAGGGRVYAFGSVDDTLVSKDGGKHWAQKDWLPVPVAYASLSGDWLLVASADEFATARLRRTGSISGVQTKRARGVRLVEGVAARTPGSGLVMFSPQLMPPKAAAKRKSSAAPSGEIMGTVDGGEHWRPLRFAGLRVTGVAGEGGRYWLRAVPAKSRGPARILESAGGGKWWVLTGVVAGSSCNAQGCAGHGAFEPYAAMQPGKAPIGLAYPPGLGAGGPPGGWAAAGGTICQVGARRLHCIRATRADLVAELAAPAVPQRAAHPVAPAIMQARCVSCPPPKYPTSAYTVSLVQGAVVLGAIISRKGRVRSLRLLAAPDRALAQAAIAAVSGWRYRPVLLNAKPVQVATQLTISFELKG